MLLLASVFTVTLLTTGMTCSPSQNKLTYNTLASTEDATSKAYSSYMTLVLQAKIPTNNVPTVANDFRTFQTVMSAAVTLAAGNTNAIATPEVTAASIKVINDVNLDKAKAGVK